MVEVTSRTLGGLYALRPCAESTSLFLGVVGRAQARFPSIRLHALNPLATHNTMLLSSSDPVSIPAFIQFVHTNVSKELRRLHNLPHRVFAGRPHVLPVANDRASEDWRLSYALSQGTKEHLVASPRDYPGASGVHALETGAPLGGWWFDRTELYNARRRRKNLSESECGTWYEVTLSPPPSWSTMSEAECRARVTEIIETICDEAERERARLGIDVLGAEAAMAIPPTYRAPMQKRSPAPMLLAATRAAYKRLKAVLVAFWDAFCQSAQRIRAGEVAVEFPLYSFPPGRPMIRPLADPLGRGGAPPAQASLL